MFVAINAWCAPVPDHVWTALSLLGNGWGLLGLIAPLLLFAPRQLWAVLCAAPFAALFARLGKGLIESPRPAAMEELHMRIVGDTLYTTSMPSGHTTTAFAVAVALVCSLPASRRPWWAVLLLSLAFVVGLSRIAVGAHWPGDVAVGMGLGVWGGLLAQLLLARVPKSWERPKSWGMRGVALLLLLAAYLLLTDDLDFVENAPIQHALVVVIAVVLLLFVWRNVRPARSL